MKPQRIWGKHTVTAALLNPQRDVCKLYVSRELQSSFRILAEERRIPVVVVEKMRDLVPVGAVHQGVAVDVFPLPTLSLSDVMAAPNTYIALLDRVTDPHNVGAIWRNAAAFGMHAIGMTEMHAPETNGTLAKSAAGALEHVPHLQFPNLVQAIKSLKTRGFFCVGLSEDGTTTPTLVDGHTPLIIVLGAEGNGLRPLTKEACDELWALPTCSAFPTLNVSSAGAVAFSLLYAKRTPQHQNIAT